MQYKAETKEYISWIDTAKGLGVFFVVLGHLWYGSSNNEINQLIYSFHVPFFWILSGYIANYNHKQKLKECYKKFIRLIIPAIFFIVISLPIYLKDVQDQQLAEKLRTIFYVDGIIAFNLPVWYLVVLFEVSICDIISGLTKRNVYVKSLSIIVLFCISYIIYKKRIILPFGLDKAILGLAFYIVGNVIRNHFQIIFKEKILLIISLYIWVMIALHFNGKVSVYNMVLGSFWNFVIAAIAGSVVFMNLAIFLEDKILQLKKISCNSILILGTHFFIVDQVLLLSKKCSVLYTYYFDFFAVLLTILMLILYEPIGIFVNKFLPFVNGKLNIRRKKYES